jgi:hypothetical protein
MKELNQKLIEITDIFIKKYNPCKINGNSCLAGKDNPCCKISRFGSPCPFMQNGICKNPNLECKVWFCETAIKNMDKDCLEAFKSLENISKLYKLINPPYLGDPHYVGADKIKTI